MFLFCSSCEFQRTLGILLFTGGIKSEDWEEVDEILNYLCYYLHNLRTAFFKVQRSLTASGFLNGL